MNLQKVGRLALKKTLEQDPTYQALLKHPQYPTLYRTFGDYVHPSMPYPYVTIHWYMGRLDNDAKTAASSTVWKVQAHVEEDEVLADQLADVIYNALHMHMPVVPPSSGYGGYSPILFEMPISEMSIHRQKTIIHMGGCYRLFLAELN